MDTGNYILRSLRTKLAKRKFRSQRKEKNNKKRKTVWWWLTFVQIILCLASFTDICKMLLHVCWSSLYKKLLFCMLSILAGYRYCNCLLALLTVFDSLIACFLHSFVHYGGGVVKWFRVLDLKSGGPLVKSSTLLLIGFVLGSPVFNSPTVFCK